MCDNRARQRPSTQRPASTRAAAHPPCATRRAAALVQACDASPTMRDGCATIGGRSRDESAASARLACAMALGVAPPHAAVSGGRFSIFVSDSEIQQIAVVTPIRSMTRSETPSSGCTRSADEIGTNGLSSKNSIGYPRMSASGESSTTMHRLLHASGSHPIPTPYDSRTNQYNQDLGLIHSTNGNHLESPNEGSSIDHHVTIYLHAQNITLFPTNETWYFASQILVSNSGGLILILTAQSTRNMFRIHSDY
ncbi:hypothetical protein F511_09961 [Dorcoceras hygrometricum]|uniref:Uncharacterized protein n=1 Tax=Dorcoceras hygrometricum TaxID=472368 RepID=A0A2Z7CQ30_9LAMI|nr:hypothetical protein F511_09961 [Dorcoceras hygrometricum]